MHLVDELTCVECGNDLATEGYVLCMDCLPSVAADYPHGGRRQQGDS